MAALFEPALEMVFHHEGGFEDNKKDSGGVTNLGISLKFYRENIKPDAIIADIENLTVNDAAAIYHKYFWQRAFEEINSQLIANRVFDLQVNTGHGIKLLQQAVNSCIGSHLDIDGALGSKTITAVNSIDEEQLYKALIDNAELFYKDLVSMHPADAEFLQGWLNRLNS